MKKLLFTFGVVSLLVLLLSSCNDFIDNNPQSRDYYWSGGEKIWLDTDSIRMILGFDNEQESNAFAASVSNAALFEGRAMVLVEIKEESVKQKVFETSSVTNRIFAYKLADSGTPFYLTGDIIIQLKQGVSQAEILSKFEVSGDIVKETETGTIVIRLKDWNKILVIANSIYESGLVEWCQPDFIISIRH